ncbi:MAG: hypothetical protein H0T78_11045, partial [Longispora sp.]|nr:hypothetical protein [Longispora sp. (in: high G+C Gram-positive bacteria)]
MDNTGVTEISTATTHDVNQEAADPNLVALVDRELRSRIVTTIGSNLGLGKHTRLAVDRTGIVYISDHEHHRVIKVDPSTGEFTVVAGTGNAGYNGDDQLATDAELNFPSGLALDSRGNLYIADPFNYRIRKVDAETGLISTVAGTGVYQSYREINPKGKGATTVSIRSPNGLVCDADDNLYIADASDHQIHKIDTTT